MPLFGPDETLPRSPQKIIVGGTSGSGKSTLAREIAVRWRLPYVEVDSLYHGPGWTVRPEYREELQAFITRPGWVVEWQGLRAALAREADTLVWLDYPVWFVMYRVGKRTLRRAISREVLWAGNVEPPLWTIFSEREHIVRWAWNTRNRVRRDALRLLADGTHLQVVRFRWPHQTDAWLARNGGRTPQTPPNAE